MRWWSVGSALALVLALPAAPAAAQSPADPACPDEVPAAMRLAGLPDVAVAGREYTVRMLEVSDGALDRLGATIGVFDRTGRGWSARYQYVKGLSQAFTVGLRGSPYTVRAAYSESLPAPNEPCTRTLTATLPVLRRIYAVVNCRRRALEPASSIVLRCAGDRLRLRNMRWSNWHADTTTGRGRLAGVGPARVTLSSPRECGTLVGFIYTRAKIRTARRTYARIPIACPIS